MRFGFFPACKASNLSARCHNPMARDDEPYWIGPTGRTDGPNRLWFSDHFSDITIGSRLSEWNSFESAPDSHLECRSRGHVLEFKFLSASAHVFVDLPRCFLQQRVRTRRWFGIARYVSPPYADHFVDGCEKCQVANISQDEFPAEIGHARYSSCWTQSVARAFYGGHPFLAVLSAREKKNDRLDDAAPVVFVVPFRPWTPRCGP
jgi:hypothetical protein